MRTLKQKWAFERCFQNKGSLAIVLSSLSRLAHCDSTLNLESLRLSQAYDLVKDVLRNYDSKQETSWEQFERRSK